MRAYTMPYIPDPATVEGLREIDEQWVCIDRARKENWIEHLRNTDLYWDIPSPEETQLEIQWDKARLDAISMLESAIMHGEVEIDTYAIAVESAKAVKSDLGWIEYDGQIADLDTIIVYNYGMLQGLMAGGVK